jgi:predicted MFS family arabinose efflux permease
MGIWAAWIPIGSVLMFNVAHPIQTALGWRSLWWMGAFLSLGCLVLYAIVVSEPPGSTEEAEEAPGSFARLLFSPNIWLLGLAFAAFSFCILAYNTWAPAYLIYALSLPPALASSYSSLMFLAAIPANILAGWLINRMPDRYVLLPVTFVLTSVILFWSFRLGIVSVIVPYMLVLGFVSNFVPTTVFTLAPETMPSLAYASLALALAIGFANLGSLAGPPAVGRVASQGSWAAASILLVAVMAAGTLLAWLSSKRLRAKWQSTSISNP